jgi:hypothetical protein
VKTFLACFYVIRDREKKRQNAGGYILDLYPNERERYHNARGWNSGTFVRGTKVLGEYSSHELAERHLLAHLREWAKTQRKLAALNISGMRSV